MGKNNKFRGKFEGLDIRSSATGGAAVLLTVVMTILILGAQHLIVEANKAQLAIAQAKNKYDLATANSVSLEIFSSLIANAVFLVELDGSDDLDDITQDAAMVAKLDAPAWEWPHPVHGNLGINICLPVNRKLEDVHALDGEGAGLALSCSGAGGDLYRTSIQMREVINDGNRMSLSVEAITTYGNKSHTNFAKIFAFSSDPPPPAVPPDCRFNDLDYIEFVDSSTAGFNFPQWLKDADNPNHDPAHQVAGPVTFTHGTYTNTYADGLTTFGAKSWPIGMDLFYNVRHDKNDFGTVIAKANRSSGLKGRAGTTTNWYGMENGLPNFCIVVTHWGSGVYASASTYCAGRKNQANHVSVEYHPFTMLQGNHLALGIGPLNDPACGWEFIAQRQKGCYAIGTQVRLFSGEEKAIEQLNPGDILLNPVTGKGIVLKKKVRGPEKEPMVRFKLRNQSELMVTQDHPMMIETGIVQARDVVPSDSLEIADGTFEKIKSIALVDSYTDDVYNLEFDTDSTEVIDHMLLANGIVSGNLYIQRQLNKAERNRLSKFEGED